MTVESNGGEWRGEPSAMQTGTQTRDQNADDAASEVPALDLEVLSGRPTDAELAASTAVLALALETSVARRRVGAGGPSRWDRSQRSLRQPLSPGAHAWTGSPV